MINGHLYRIQGWLKSGVSMDEVCRRFRNLYTREEIESFLPGERRTIRKKRVAKATTDE